jgi:hypothetical protein
LNRAIHIRQTKLVSALHAYLATTDRPFWLIATEIGIARSALLNWKNGKTKQQFEYLDRIEAFSRRQEYRFMEKYGPEHLRA